MEESSKKNSIFAISGNLPEENSSEGEQNVDKVHTSEGDYFSVKPEVADFETALSATGFGKFNLAILAIAIPSAWSSIFETTTMSYVFPAAQCDLELTMENKGQLNASAYLGKPFFSYSAKI